ncbi:hypothetical protein [Haloarcula halophila]|uniref:hypothetical protein n=1 Tax=Haloarcula TaxID=2237 RepID=UPI0023E3E4EE|nr:hypothetical protein [Halomicroarcula sp. DFY41]
MQAVDRSDIVVARPIGRDTLRAIDQGYLVTCTNLSCEWQGLFPDADLAATACERHYDHELRSGQYHRGDRTYTVVELLDDETACTLDDSKLGLSVAENRYGTADGSVRQAEFPRTTQDVPALVERGDRIIVPGDREQKVRAVSETRSLGLPTWSVNYCDVDDDLLSGRLPPRGQRELIARDGAVYCSYGPDPLAAPAFEVIGETEHQADFSEFDGGASA